MISHGEKGRLDGEFLSGVFWRHIMDWAYKCILQSQVSNVLTSRFLTKRVKLGLYVTRTYSDKPIDPDLESESSLLSTGNSEKYISQFESCRNQDPLDSSVVRRNKYRFFSPRYDRGPYHPIQPLPPSDLRSREFIPGPFSYPRLKQTYDSTVSHDLLTLLYRYYPPGEKPTAPVPRLRKWEGDNPYYKGRHLRPPRGGKPLKLWRQPITHSNIPRLERVVVHSMVSEALKDRAYLRTAAVALEAITCVRARVHRAKTSVAEWNLIKGKPVSLTSTLHGELMYDFVAKLVDLVLPRIKDWKGLNPRSGDNSGNITFGLAPSAVSLFPEIEVNYDMYPVNMIPGCHITIQTTARIDRDAHLLLALLGFPYCGPITRWK